MTLRLGDGQIVEFTASGSTWVNPDGYLPVLAKVTAGWTLTDTTGGVTRFDSDGRVAAIETPGEPDMTFDRSTPGVVVVESNGYEVTLSDTTKLVADGPDVGTDPDIVSGTDGLVDRAEASDGRIVDYGYSVSDGLTVLVSVSSPHTAGQASGTYGVRSFTMVGSAIKTITDRVDATRTNVVVDNTFDDLGRVGSQVSDQGDTTTFAYGKKPDPILGLVDAVGYTTVTSGLSTDVSVYHYDSTGRLLTVTDPNGKTTSRTWSGEQLTSSNTRSDLATSYEFDSAHRVTRVVETPDGGSPRPTEIFTYVTGAADPGAASDQRVASQYTAGSGTTSYTYDGASTSPASVSTDCDYQSLKVGTSCPSSGQITTTYTYFAGSKAGLVKDETDADGVKTSYTYHDDRSVATTTIYEDDGTPRTTHTDRVLPSSGSWPFTDAAITYATRTETPGGEVTWEGYDVEGRIRETRDPLYNGTTHKATRTTYRLDGSVASVADPGDKVTTFDVHRAGDAGWAEASNIAEVRISTDPDGISTINKIDRSGDTVVSQTGNLSVPTSLATTTSVYRELGRLDYTVDPGGVRTTYRYDDEGRVTETTTGNTPTSAVHTVTTDYDTKGQVISETTPMGDDPDGAGHPVTRKTSYTYDDDGHKLTQLEGAAGPTGQQLLTGYQYDGQGRLWRTIEHRHGAVDVADALTLHDGDKVTETRYTLAGRTAQEIGPPIDAITFDWTSALSAKSVTTFHYDAAGRQDSVTAPGGKVSHTTYDVDGRTVTTTTPGGFTTTFHYDGLGRQVGVETPSGLTGTGDPTTVVATTTYDASGRVVAQDDPHDPAATGADPSTRYTTYTDGGRVHTVTDALEHTVTYGYDERGNRVSRTAKDDAGADVVESWSYDQADRELTHTVPPPRAGAASMTTTSTYDPEFGWLATVTDPTGRVETRGYYADGTRKSSTFSKTGTASEVDSWWVNGRGWVTKSTAGTKTFVYTFDRAGQQLSQLNQGVWQTSHTYALSGVQLSLGFPEGTSSTVAPTTFALYSHDVSGNTTEVSVKTGTGTPVPYATNTYDDDNRITNELITAAGGATRDSHYDAAGRLDLFTEVMQRPDTTWSTYTSALTYRPDGRMASETVNSDPTVTYDYDDAGQLVSATDGVNDQSWTYGTRGNRLTSVTGGLTTAYDTNPNGSVAKTTTGTKTVTYTYDDAGRRTYANYKTGTTQTATWTGGYTVRGLLGLTMDIAGSDSKSASRSYDAEGLIETEDIAETGMTQKTWHYQWDTTQAIPQVIETKAAGSTNWLRAVWGDHRIGFKNATASPVWFQYDAHGSVIRTEDTNTSLYDGPPAYTAFGQPSDTTDYARIGYRAEQSTGGLIYLRHRDYDPATGQFTTQDPLDGVDGTASLPQRFTFANNDSVDLSDPLGLRVDDCRLLIGFHQCNLDQTPIPFGPALAAAVRARKAEVEVRHDMASSRKANSGIEIPGLPPINIESPWDLAFPGLAAIREAIRLNNAAHEAENWAIDQSVKTFAPIGPDGAVDPRYLDTGSVNAARHFFLSSLLRYLFGHTISNYKLNRHEHLNEGADRCAKRDRRSDLHNNRIGQEYGNLYDVLNVYNRREVIQHAVLLEQQEVLDIHGGSSCRR